MIGKCVEREADNVPGHAEGASKRKTAEGGGGRKSKSARLS